MKENSGQAEFSKIFWERFYQECLTYGKRPNVVGKEIGLSSGILSKWKHGKSIPSGLSLVKIAKFFNVSIDYLTGLTAVRDISKKPKKTKKSAEQ